MQIHKAQTTCKTHQIDIPIADCDDIVTDLATSRVTTEFNSTIDLGLSIGGFVPATFVLERDGCPTFSVNGRVYLDGITTNQWRETAFHYFFEGYEEDERTSKGCA